MERQELATPWAASDRPVPRRLVQPLQAFLHTEVAGGIVLVLAAVVALVWANSPWGSSYEALWTTELSIGLGRFELTEDLRHWVNDLLMALFFFVVGLEIKRELLDGELRERRAAMLPAMCALGGMVVPAALYLLVTAGTAGAPGWGIPMATDIAFAVGVLSLVGKRAPNGLKVLLLSLAIVDDLGAILVIAVFYSQGLAVGWLAVAAAVVAVIVVLRRLEVRSLVPYVVLAGALWLAVFSSGVHATIAGVVLGLLTPARPFYRLEAAVHAADPPLHDGVASTMLDVRNVAREAVSPLERLETQLHPWSAYVVLPLFAVANAGVVLSGGILGEAVSRPITLGVLVGLVVGKPLGIVLAGLVAVRVGVAVLPEGVTWRHLAGVGALAGIGFTVAIFIAGLAFGEPGLVSAAKIGVLFASVVAGILGAVLLWRGATRPGAE